MLRQSWTQGNQALRRFPTLCTPSGDVLRKNNHLDWSDLSEDGHDLSDFLLSVLVVLRIFPWMVVPIGLVDSTLTKRFDSWT
ncbi:hypothetical protein BDW42DRAFT_164562 [Aspergillus taichungensis]|uniref:Uncharacterized protein n=1 Tax=Aspergillus taichungensis TaxID=482145 RepID=A0A2J5I1G3_9EURO|nr:hypothetical protein BDW42DRAFT_164562 [Aspergillus taichungensis]